MDKRFGTDLTVGSIPRHLLGFSLPMLAGNLIQIGHNIINTVWVGHLVGENGVGAIGVSFPILFILMGFAMGMSMATTILVAQYYGAKDFTMVGRVANNSFSLTLILGIMLSAIAVIFANPILALMKTPTENFAMASTYLRITLGGFIVFYLSFIINSVLRGIGDTVTPLMFMAIGIGMNALLDPFFIGGWGPFPHFGLTGAAWATVLSQTMALAISIYYLNVKSHMVAFIPKNLVLSGHMTALLFKIGFPSIIQQSLVSLGAVFVTTFVNSFGSAATNAFGAVTRVDMFAIMPAMTMSMAVAALSGQNLGAGKPERVREVFKWGVIMTSLVTISISLIAVFLPGMILTMFGLGDDAAVMTMGIKYLHIVGSCYIFLSIAFISNGVINGAGHTMITMVFSLFSLWVVRVPLCWLLSRSGFGITGIWYGVSISFLALMVVSLGYYYTGRWRKAVVIKTPATVPMME